MKLYFSPRSSYSQKVLIAMYEAEIAFEPIVIDPREAGASAFRDRVNPMGRVPTLVLKDGHTIWESTIIIEYLAAHVESAAGLVPSDIDHARQTRFADRQYDWYFHQPMQVLALERERSAEQRDGAAEANARETLERAYELADLLMESRTWAMGDKFTLADCAAAPALVRLKELYPYGTYPHLVAYADRLRARPSVARVLAEAAGS